MFFYRYTITFFLPTRLAQKPRESAARKMGNGVNVVKSLEKRIRGRFEYLNILSYVLEKIL